MKVIVSFLSTTKLHQLALTCGFGLGSTAAYTALVKPQDSHISLVGGSTRFARSLQIGLHISIDYYFSMMGLTENHANYAPMMARIHQRAADRILEGCLKNGGPYIKLGQGLVSMSHILPKQYISTLKVLQDQCLMRAENEIQQLFNEDFGKSTAEIFDTFGPQPMASASLAQVYKATTRSGDSVAVKVQYIDLRTRFNSDVSTIKFLLRIAGMMHRDFNFAWILDDLADTLQQELDFVNEGKNAERCARDLKQFGVYVPKIYWEHTSSRVLVMEYIEGFKINDKSSLEANGFSLKEVDQKMFQAFGHQIFHTGYVHADPHPGNILVRRQDGKTQLVILDHGLYQEIKPSDRIALSHMWKAIVMSDHQKMQYYAQQLGVDDYTVLAEILTQSPLRFQGFKLKVSLSEEEMKHMTQATRDRFDMIMKILRAMPRSLLLVIRNLNTIRAISHDHGNPVNRYALLARAATKTAYSDDLKGRSFTKIPYQIYFEARIMSGAIRSWILEKIMTVLIWLRLLPDIRSSLSQRLAVN